MKAGKLAALHLIENGIDGLVVIGGDGSLTGANVFHQEWPTLVKELASAGAITPAEDKKIPHHPHYRYRGFH